MTDTSYEYLLEHENKIKLLEPFKGAKAHHNMQCMICEHMWVATPISKRQTYKKNNVGGCPECNNKRKDDRHKDSRQNNIEQLRARGIIVLTEGYDGKRLVGNNTKIKVQNTECGHVFEATPTNLLVNNVECPSCGGQKRVATLTTWSKANSEKWRETATEWQQYKSVVTALTEQTYKQHKNKINPSKLKRGKAGVEGAYHLDHIVPKRFCFDNAIPPEVCADFSNLQMIGWLENVGSRSHIKGTLPLVFLKYVNADSKLQLYASQLQKTFPNGQLFHRVGDTVVTCWDEQTNHAVVVLPTDQAFANQKNAHVTRKALIEAGVNFTIIFEDEMTNQALIKSKLSHYAKQSTTTKIHARHCTIAECSKEEKKTLLNANHVQGNDNAPIAYGAYYKGQIVAVMTFSKPRVALGQKGLKSEGLWELSRFCTDVRYRIPGIASKLLKHFQRSHEWKEIYSYADKRWSIGTMYHALGFTLTADNPPDYFYIVDGKRKHRWNYRKDILKNTLPNYDASLTEYQNMENHGMWRVWDCGTLKFTLLANS